jgi:hypothetical protein
VPGEGVRHDGRNKAHAVSMGAPFVPHRSRYDEIAKAVGVTCAPTTDGSINSIIRAVPLSPLDG